MYMAKHDNTDDPIPQPRSKLEILPTQTCKQRGKVNIPSDHILCLGSRNERLSEVKKILTEQTLTLEAQVRVVACLMTLEYIACDWADN